jgi:hypothetical protein
MCVCVVCACVSTMPALVGTSVWRCRFNESTRSVPPARPPARPRAARAATPLRVPVQRRVLNGRSVARGAVPVNTRWMMLLMLVVTLTGNFGMAPMDLLYFDPEKVLKFQVSVAPPAFSGAPHSSSHSRDRGITTLRLRVPRCGGW